MGEITRLLDAARRGDPKARERFFAGIYHELDRLARSKLGRDSRLTLIDASSLVHEVYLRLAQQSELPGRDRRAFFAYASRIMHNVIVDYVRSRQAERHGGTHQRITLDTGLADQPCRTLDLVSLGDAMESLHRVDERAHWVVEMRYFGGMEINEIADFLEISPATVKRDWQKARAFLLQVMQVQPDPA